MNLISKIADRHLSKQACIYIRQSTLAQVRLNQESTDRQYNLVDKALSLGWNQQQIRILDRDLGQSGTAATTRMDFKTLVSDVAMGQVGAIFALEASRLARSNQDWHRLLELGVTGRFVQNRTLSRPMTGTDGQLRAFQAPIAFRRGFGTGF
jgi:DNA invertase Pin-like site-specific DNA recombinase